jgi:hypothetical protein
LIRSKVERLETGRRIGHFRVNRKVPRDNFLGQFRPSPGHPHNPAAVKPQAGTHFLQDPSGKPVDLAGSAGATIVLRGFRGDMRNYAGPVSIISSGPKLLQVYALGDFEGIVTWAVRLDTAGCANAAPCESGSGIKAGGGAGQGLAQ